MGRNVNDLHGSDLWEGQVEVKAVTEKAVLVDYEGEEAWVPKSQIHRDCLLEQKKGKEGVLVIPMWLAVKEGWAEEPDHEEYPDFRYDR